MIDVEHNGKSNSFARAYSMGKVSEYDNVYHLNNVDNFHGMIETTHNHYRGVASKYINRYTALFA